MEKEDRIKDLLRLRRILKKRKDERSKRKVELINTILKDVYEKD